MKRNGRADGMDRLDRALVVFQNFLIGKGRETLLTDKSRDGVSGSLRVLGDLITPSTDRASYRPLDYYVVWQIS